jgi:hypothetical protein
MAPLLPSSPRRRLHLPSLLSTVTAALTLTEADLVGHDLRSLDAGQAASRVAAMKFVSPMKLATKRLTGVV